MVSVEKITRIRQNVMDKIVQKVSVRNFIEMRQLLVGLGLIWIFGRVRISGGGQIPDIRPDIYDFYRISKLKCQN